MTEKRRIVLAGIVGATLIPFGILAVVNAVIHHDAVVDMDSNWAREHYVMRLGFFLAAVGILWSAIDHWKEMKKREILRQDYLSRPENLEHFLAWKKRHPGQDWYESLDDVLEGRDLGEQVYVGYVTRYLSHMKASPDDKGYSSYYDTGGFMLLFGLWFIGCSIYGFAHLPEYGEHPGFWKDGIWIQVVFCLFGTIGLIGGVQGIMLMQQRRKYQWKEWNNSKNRSDLGLKNNKST